MSNDKEPASEAKERKHNDPAQLKIEINHILESGANDIRLIELFEKYHGRHGYWFDKTGTLKEEITRLKAELEREREKTDKSAEEKRKER